MQSLSKQQEEIEINTVVTAVFFFFSPRKATIIPKIEPGTSGVTASPQKSDVKQKKVVTGKSKEALLEQAPVKSFGVDLEHWENPGNIEAPLQVK